MHRQWKHLLIAAAFAAFAAAPAAAKAECALDIDAVGAYGWNGADGRGYDVFDPTLYYQPLMVRVRAKGGACRFFATVSPAFTAGARGVLSGPGGELQYMIYRDAMGDQPLLPAVAATQADVLAGAAEKDGDTVTYQIVYAIMPQQVVPSGAYSGQIDLAVYEGDLGSGVLRAQQQVPLTVIVPGRAELTFSEGAFDPDDCWCTVHFNVMRQGDIKGTTMRARSNDGYRLFVQSQNGGVMRLMDPSDPSVVPYSMFVDGKLVAFGASETESTTQTGTTDVMGKPHRFDFRINDIADASAGDYQDVISITIMTLK